MFFLIALIFSLPLLAEEIESDSLRALAEQLSKAVNLKQEGKSIKAGKALIEVERLLVKLIHSGKKYSWPAGCSFRYNPYTESGLFCSNSEIQGANVIFSVDKKKNKAILEKLEDCVNESCIGEFTFEKMKSGKLYHLSGDSPTIIFNLKFYNIKREAKNAD